MTAAAVSVETLLRHARMLEAELDADTNSRRLSAVHRSILRARVGIAWMQVAHARDTERAERVSPVHISLRGARA